MGAPGFFKSAHTNSPHKNQKKKDEFPEYYMWVRAEKRKKPHYEFEKIFMDWDFQFICELTRMFRLLPRIWLIYWFSRTSGVNLLSIICIRLLRILDEQYLSSPI